MDSFFFLTIQSMHKEISISKGYNIFCLSSSLQQGGLLPENQKNNTPDKNIWSSSIIGITVDPSAYNIFRI